MTEAIGESRYMVGTSKENSDLWFGEIARIKGRVQKVKIPGEVYIDLEDGSRQEVAPGFLVADVCFKNRGDFETVRDRVYEMVSASKS